MTIKLYYSPGACSLAPHIALREAGLPFEIERVSLKTKRTTGGADFTVLNPKGYVPALALEGDEVLTEAAVILQYVADQKPESGLAAQNGTLARYRQQEMLNFLATEIHKSFGPLFAPTAPDETKQAARDRLAKRFEYLASRLDGSYLFGETFTVADAYLFTLLSWAPHVGVDLKAWPALAAYVERVAARPAVRAAIEAEKAS